VIFFSLLQEKLKRKHRKRIIELVFIVIQIFTG
jgi:hypothetical protein